MANSSGSPGKSTPGARRLGGQQPAPRPSAGAQRRQARARQARSRRFGWIAVGLVVIAIAAIVTVKLTTGGSSPTPGTSVITGPDRNPALAPASMVDPVASVPASVFDSVGVNGQAPGFVVTKNQPPLAAGGRPRFVYVGGEFCPYCAAMRWSLVAALSRFGTFTGLKQTASSPTDGNIPTFSFVGATYTSRYLTFTPYEQSDRLGNPLQTVPKDVLKLYGTYDGSGSSSTKFSPGGAGIPFLDIANRYVSAGDPPYLSSFFGNGTGPLVNGGPGVDAIATAVHDPSSAVGKGIGANGFIVMANYLSAAICAVDNSQPAAVCHSPGVKAAAAELAKQTPIG